MKRIIKNWVLALSVILLAANCDEIIDQLNITFELGPHYVDFEIEPDTVGAIVTSFDVVLHDLVGEVEGHGGEMSQLDLIELESASISIVSGATNFNAFESFEVFIKTPTLDEKKIAWMDAVPMDATMLAPSNTTDNLKEYMLEGEYTVVLKGILREDITETAVLQAEIFFKVNL